MFKDLEDKCESSFSSYAKMTLEVKQTQPILQWPTKE